ncbi:hypothetical protein Lste_0716 [Legionella steelei]|uniref:Uncharacterized protein n=1 Tax=Legionella steelei TaxID=947033 RepID=A0A0W0ZMB0_9GAMM|nr:hypothetical protein Lste_0716 [Legionella steelei]
MVVRIEHDGKGTAHLLLSAVLGLKRELKIAVFDSCGIASVRGVTKRSESCETADVYNRQFLVKVELGIM